MKTHLTLAIAFCCSSALAQEINQPADTTKTTISPMLKPQVVNFNAPLYYLGEKEISEHELRILDPHDIKAITVLKDSTATARYGERGRRGVVIIEMSQPLPPARNKKRSTIE